MIAQASKSLDRALAYHAYLACIAVVVACVLGVYICRKPRSSRNHLKVDLREVKVDSIQPLKPTIEDIPPIPKAHKKSKAIDHSPNRTVTLNRISSLPITLDTRKSSLQPSIGERKSSLYTSPSLQFNSETNQLESISAHRLYSSAIFSESEMESIQKYLPKTIQEENRKEADYIQVLDAYIEDYFIQEELSVLQKDRGKSDCDGLIKPTAVKPPQKVLFQYNINEDTPEFW